MIKVLDVKEGKAYDEMVKKIQESTGPEGQGIYGTLEGNCLIYLRRHYGKQEVEIIGIEIKKEGERVLSITTVDEKKIVGA
jgi:hypothetical protein